MNKFCTKCGSQLNSESKFCSSCGNAIQTASESIFQQQTETTKPQSNTTLHQQQYSTNQQYYSNTNPPNYPQQVIINQNALPQTKMFANPFSFKGRIRRLEYGLSIVINLVSSALVYALISTIDSFITIVVLWLLYYIALMWFSLAQATKRCHDLGKSGWYQLIPIFNPFWLLLSNGQTFTNQYGEIPKNNNINQQFYNHTTLQNYNTSYSKDGAGLR